MRIKGMTFGWGAHREEYREKYSEESMKLLKKTGCEWIALSFYTYQDSFSSTNIYFDYGYTVTDIDIMHAINLAHKIGLKVCLKPVVNCRDGIWRARIGFPQESSYWGQWFHSYSNFIRHYAQIAEDTACEMFCIGCEMLGTESRVSEWRELISRVRILYSGITVYNTNHGHELEVEWFDCLDMVGTSGYFPVGQKPGDSEENMIKNWRNVRDQMYRVHTKFNKPVIFMEIGCRSGKGFSMMPWDCGHNHFPYDEEEQANFYSSAFKVFWREPWFAGFFWWDWSARLYSLDEAKTNKGFGIYGKKAAKVLKSWYNI